MIRKQFFKRRKGILGASMVEFAIGMPIIAFIILGIFDAGMVLRQQSNLTDLTAELCRAVAADLGRSIPKLNAKFPGAKNNLDCAGEISDSGREFLNTPARKFLFNHSGPKINFSGNLIQQTKLGQPQSVRLTVEGRVRLNCVLCRFFLRGTELKASSDQLVESQLAADVCPLSTGEINITDD